MTRRLREIEEPFAVAPPSGARVRARLHASDTDSQVLVAIGTHLGSLARGDLARRCREGRLDAEARATSRRERKRSLTATSSSRWAGAITRESEDSWQLAMRNLIAEHRSLHARISRVRRRLAVPVGGRRGRLGGYGTSDERFQKQRRLQVLECRLAEVEARLEEGRLSICRGGKSLARAHHHLDDADLSDTEWRDGWNAARLFITADGEKDKAWGNETIRFDPAEHWVEIKLPVPLAHLANRPYGRYRLSCPVAFSYRDDEVAAQAATGAVRYDVTFDPGKARWYLDASWKRAVIQPPALDELRGHRVLAVDVNTGHLAAMVVDSAGNPVGRPITSLLALSGLTASTRDGHLREAISGLIKTAEHHACRAIVIENLDFADAREMGREQTGRRPSRGKRGRTFRRLVSGIPTAKFAGRLIQMASNAGLAVIAVDPAYTSMWGAEHWLVALREISTDASGHHAAALVIGRRGLEQRARRRERCDSTPAAHGRKRATNSAMWPVPPGEPVGLFEQRTRKARPRKARGQPHLRQRTRPAEQEPRGDQVTQDRSGPPTKRDSVPLSV